MTYNDLTPDTQAALVGIIRRAARRGRELREAEEKAASDLAGKQALAAAVGVPQRGEVRPNFTPQ